MATTLTWGLAVATFNRADSLVASIGYALDQSRPPHEIVICDSSADWQATRERVTKLLADSGQTPRFQYLRSTVAQQTVQRNMAIDNATADILFMIDDDAFLRRDAAELVMRAYEADPLGSLVAVGLGEMATWQPVPASPGDVESAPASPRRNRLIGVFLSFGRPSAPPAKEPARLPVIDVPLRPAGFIDGFRITVRRQAIERVRFDENLISGLHEDGDVVRRLTEAGIVAMIDRPIIFHAAAPRSVGESRRGIMQRFGWILNSAYLDRKYYGSGPYIRLLSLVDWLRWMVIDSAAGITRRDFARLRGCIAVLPALLRLLVAKQDRIGAVVVRETAAMKSRLRQSA